MPPSDLLLLLYKERNLGMIRIINMYAQTTLIYCDAKKDSDRLKSRFYTAFDYIITFSFKKVGLLSV